MAELSNDAMKVVELLKSEQKSIAMVAPSFVVDFDYHTFAGRLRTLGFDKVTELTFGAKEVNRFYHHYIKTYKGRCISSVCPAVVNLVLSKYPHLKDKLIPCVSPMVAMARILRKEYPKHKIVFIGPCIQKKAEAKKYPADIDHALTYIETDALLRYGERSFRLKKQKGEMHRFDRFYNDATKIYPLSGGLAKSMHVKEILKEDEVIIDEDPEDSNKILAEFDKHPGKVKFIDLLFCAGGCIGGTGMKSKAPIEERKKKVLDYMEYARTHHTGERVGLDRFVEGIDFTTKF